jgi:hypothetical protein
MDELVAAAKSAGLPPGTIFGSGGELRLDEPGEERALQKLRKRVHFVFSIQGPVVVSTRDRPLSFAGRRRRNWDASSL